MKQYIVVSMTFILCLSAAHTGFAQQHEEQTSDSGRPVRIQPVSVAPTASRTERDVRVRPVEPIATSESVSSVAQTAPQAMSSYESASRPVYEQKTFWQKTKDGVSTAGKYTWGGIKKGAHWTWIGTKKVGYYMKEGFVSVAEKTGMIKDTELSAHSDIMNLANKTLVESKTKREIREDRLRRVGLGRVTPAISAE
jgi:hypothetical protein